MYFTTPQTSISRHHWHSTSRIRRHTIAAPPPRDATSRNPPTPGERTTTATPPPTAPREPSQSWIRRQQPSQPNHGSAIAHRAQPLRTTHLSTHTIHNGTPAQPASHPPQHHSNTPIVQRNNQPHSADRPSPFFTNPTNARPTHACHTRARRYMPPLLTSPLTQRRHPLTTSNRCHTIEPTRTPGVTK